MLICLLLVFYVIFILEKCSISDRIFDFGRGGLSEPELNEFLEFLEFALNSVNSLIRLIQVQTIALGTKADTGLADKACAV
jgi:hypothetical protein